MGKRLTKCQLSEINFQQAHSLATLKKIRSHLIAVIGYKLWNPLSTIQVCLESLANEPTMPIESRQIILDTAVKDIQYLHQLIEDCISFAHLKPQKKSQNREMLQCQTSPQEILQTTLVRILELNSILANYSDFPKVGYLDKEIILSDDQEEILEHIRKNLIAIVGHELRTPLCTIEVCLESLSCEPEITSKYRQKMLEIALHDVKRLEKLIKDFFILDRLEKGQIYQRPEYVRVREVIDLALTSLRSRQDRENLPNIVVEIPTQLPPVQVDEDSLVEALIKLLDNACKFTKPNGEIKIQARIVESQTTDPNIMLEVVISDNGRGIVPSHLEAIFNCFYQEEDFLRRTVNGTGIGLAICQRIINNFGGKIWANSAGKDRGSSIHFTLPVAI
jgi:signal transduction histidine kinase